MLLDEEAVITSIPATELPAVERPLTPQPAADETGVAPSQDLRGGLSIPQRRSSLAGTALIRSANTRRRFCSLTLAEEHAYFPHPGCFGGLGTGVRVSCEVWGWGLTDDNISYSFKRRYLGWRKGEGARICLPARERCKLQVAPVSQTTPSSELAIHMAAIGPNYPGHDAFLRYVHGDNNVALFSSAIIMAVRIYLPKNISPCTNSGKQAVFAVSTFLVLLALTAGVRG